MPSKICASGIKSGKSPAYSLYSPTAEENRPPPPAAPAGTFVPRKKTRDCVSFSVEAGGYLFSRIVSNQVPSAYKGLTTVFGMGTGGSP